MEAARKIHSVANTGARRRRPHSGFSAWTSHTSPASSSEVRRTEAWHLRPHVGVKGDETGLQGSNAAALGSCLGTVSSFLFTAGYVLTAVCEPTRYALRLFWALLLPKALLAARVLAEQAERRREAAQRGAQTRRQRRQQQQAEARPQPRTESRTQAPTTRRSRPRAHGDMRAPRGVRCESPNAPSAR